jgi:hypothetical protein
MPVKIADIAYEGAVVAAKSEKRCSRLDWGRLGPRGCVVDMATRRSVLLHGGVSPNEMCTIPAALARLFPVTLVAFTQRRNRVCYFLGHLCLPACPRAFTCCLGLISPFFASSWLNPRFSCQAPTT